MVDLPSKNGDWKEWLCHLPAMDVHQGTSLHHFQIQLKWSWHQKIQQLYLCLPNTHLSWIYKPSTFFGYHHFFCMSPKNTCCLKIEISISISSRIFYPMHPGAPWRSPIFFRTAFAPLPPPPPPPRIKEDVMDRTFDWRWIFVETSKVRCVRCCGWKSPGEWWRFNMV